ncbi:hypothetical protein C8R45DRAFT_941303 [Mycena sanguinolenta]|nr:hypothetical protein C8R45DRAFT_941303 [Mycena sanguinolenta]
MPAICHHAVGKLANQRGALGFHSHASHAQKSTKIFSRPVRNQPPDVPQAPREVPSHIGGGKELVEARDIPAHIDVLTAAHTAALRAVSTSPSSSHPFPSPCLPMRSSRSRGRHMPTKLPPSSCTSLSSMGKACRKLIAGTKGCTNCGVGNHLAENYWAHGGGKEGFAPAWTAWWKAPHGKEPRQAMIDVANAKRAARAKASADAAAVAAIAAAVAAAKDLPVPSSSAPPVAAAAFTSPMALYSIATYDDNEVVVPSPSIYMAGVKHDTPHIFTYPQFRIQCWYDGNKG